MMIAIKLIISKPPITPPTTAPMLGVLSSLLLDLPAQQLYVNAQLCKVY